MILRCWKARTTAELLPRYLEQVQRVVEPYLRSFAGFRGADFATRALERGELEVLVLTRWESRDALEGFAASGGSHSYVPDEIAATLTSFDDASEHFETVLTLEN